MELGSCFRAVHAWHESSRSYVVRHDGDALRRNRRQLTENTGTTQPPLFLPQLDDSRIADVR